MKIVKSLLLKLSYCISFVFGYSFFEKKRGVMSILVTKSIERKLKKKGENLRIVFPITLSDAQNISIGNNVTIGGNARIRAVTRYGNDTFSPLIVIGDNVVINRNFQISAIDKIEIKDNVFMAENVYISDTTHGCLDYSDIEIPPAVRTLYSKGPVLIEEKVWLGKNVCILAGVTVGRNSVIGANSVVTHNIPPYCIAVGAPARIVKRIK